MNIKRRRRTHARGRVKEKVWEMKMVKVHNMLV
jgi:hypothetical protein